MRAICGLRSHAVLSCLGNLDLYFYLGFSQAKKFEAYTTFYFFLTLRHNATVPQYKAFQKIK